MSATSDASRSASARMAAASLKALGGWEFVGGIPKVRRAVCLAVPHTHNMDGLLLVLLAGSVGMPISWMVKEVWTKKFLVGALVRRAGAVAIDRTKANGVVDSMIEEFGRRDDLYLVVPPEGTRARTECWKSGFYRIALGADVPVVPGFLDYPNKRGGFLEPIAMTGDVKRDMDALRAVYRDAAPMARYPENFGPIRLREEME